MDPNSVKSTLSNLAFGNVMAAAARDYQKVLFLKLGPHLLTFPREFDALVAFNFPWEIAFLL